MSDREEATAIIQQLVQEIQKADLADLSRLGKVSAGLEQAAERWSDSRPAAARLALLLNKAVERIILEECGAVEDPVDIVAHGISMLQRVVEEERETPDDPDLFKEIAALAGESQAAAPEGELHQEDSPPETLLGMSWEEDSALEEILSEDGQDTFPEEQEEVDEDDNLEDLEVDAEIFFDFVSEAEEHLNTAESALLSLETNPQDEEQLNTAFRAFHTIKGASGFLNLKDVTRVSHAVEDLLDATRKGTLRFNSSISDVALQSIDLLKELIAAAQTQIENGELQPRDVSDFVARVEAAAAGDGQEDSTAGAESATSPEASSPATSAPAPPSETRHRDQLFVRVGTEKLDQLVNMVGELVIGQSQVTQNPEIVSSSNQKLTRDISQLERITRDLQEVAMSMRMVPIRPTFERMARMVRDLARKCGKRVAFQMSGEETELDKNVVDALVDPLIHMVRNAVDHGVEFPQERVAAGKPEQGQVTLTACHRGGNIVIELSDDGKGLDPDKIRKTAVERGLARPDEELSEEQIYDFIFQPGFSTAEKVSDVSGRGVGMDVVRRSIEKLRGAVEVRSEPGKGSTFTTRLPLTLAIIDGMVIGVAEQRYVLPLTSIVRSLRPDPEQVFTVMGRGEMVKVHGDLFPLVRLHERFGVEPRVYDPWESLVVLVEGENGACCLLVDELLGIQQVVIKGLDDELRRDRSLAGCTILGDGRVGLILDVNGLVPPASGGTYVSAEKNGAMA